MKKSYTLLELMVAMLIFVVMMGILTNVFSSISTVSTQETTKANLTNDASTFYDYLTSDLKGAVAYNFLAPQMENGNIRDMEDLVDAADDAESYDQSISYSSTTLSFYSNSAPYTALYSSLDINRPYITYLFDAGAGTIVRRMESPTDTVDGTILEGVTAFTVNCWEDYAGGTNAGSGMTSKPACITVTITLQSANPFINSVDKGRTARSFTKTIYLN